MSLRARQITLDTLPDLSPRPDSAVDYTGRRRGKMTAFAWCRRSHSGKATVWLCRCDCGLFEYRRPGTWAARPFPDDMCRACLQAKGPNARHTAPERRQRWCEELRSLGLTDAEIARIQAPGANVETRGRAAVEIREQLSLIAQ